MGDVCRAVRREQGRCYQMEAVWKTLCLFKLDRKILNDYISPVSFEGFLPISSVNDLGKINPLGVRLLGAIFIKSFSVTRKRIRIM